MIAHWKGHDEDKQSQEKLKFENQFSKEKKKVAPYNNIASNLKIYRGEQGFAKVEKQDLFDAFSLALPRFKENSIGKL